MSELNLNWEQSTDDMLTLDVVKPEGSVMADDLLILAIVDNGEGAKRFALGILDADGHDRTDDKYFATLAEAQAAAAEMVPKILAGAYDIMACMHCGTDVYPDEVICSACDRKYHRR